VTKAQVSQLVAILMACYPNARVPDGTVVAYETFLLELEHEQAQQAVANVVRASKFFPAIAEVVTAYEALTPRTEADQHQRYLGPRYTGRPMAPSELHAEIQAFLARPDWQAPPAKPEATPSPEAT
jgi:Loader and inhibitor of phage G40P